VLPYNGDTFAVMRADEGLQAIYTEVRDMLPLFFFLILVAFGSILLSLKASHEISRILAGSCAVFCLIFGFALAPWFIQVLIVIGLLVLERIYPLRRLGEVPVTLTPNKRR
jgi:hypothetical protein